MLRQWQGSRSDWMHCLTYLDYIATVTSNTKSHAKLDAKNTCRLAHTMDYRPLAITSFFYCVFIATSAAKFAGIPAQPRVNAFCIVMANDWWLTQYVSIQWLSVRFIEQVLFQSCLVHTWSAKVMAAYLQRSPYNSSGSWSMTYTSVWWLLDSYNGSYLVLPSKYTWYSGSFINYTAFATREVGAVAEKKKSAKRSHFLYQSLHVETFGVFAPELVLFCRTLVVVLFLPSSFISSS